MQTLRPRYIPRMHQTKRRHQRSPRALTPAYTPRAITRSIKSLLRTAFVQPTPHLPGTSSSLNGHNYKRNFRLRPRPLIPLRRGLIANSIATDGLSFVCVFEHRRRLWPPSSYIHTPRVHGGRCVCRDSGTHTNFYITTCPGGCKPCPPFIDRMYWILACATNLPPDLPSTAQPVQQTQPPVLLLVVLFRRWKHANVNVPGGASINHNSYPHRNPGNTVLPAGTHATTQPIRTTSGHLVC